MSNTITTAKKISERAIYDSSEFISECIAESMTAKARPVSKQVVRIILEE